MKETEKIEIMHFDQEGYLEDGRNVYEAGKKMTALADRVHEEGYDAVFLMGVGGTWDEFMQLEYLMNKFGDRDLEVYLIHAAEWNVMGHKRMTDRSVVLTASESGTTPEVLEAVGKMREMGVRVFAMTNPEGKIGQAVGAENCVMMASDHGAGGCEKGYYLADCFGLRLLNRRGCFPKFDLFIEQTKDVWKDMLDIRKRFEPRAEELAKKYGATDVVDYKDGDIVAQIMELTNNEKVDRVIIAGGTESTINDAYRMVKCGGNISNVAGYDFSKEFHLTVADAGCLVNHVTLTGRLCAGGRYRLENLMALIKNGRLDPTLLITHELHGFDKIEDGFRMMDERKTPDTIKPIVII